MASRQLRTLIQHLRRSVCPRGADRRSDAQLLERWAAWRDEAAFEVLLWRHGPVVLSVCRRLLRHSHDIDDAFQAAFLTLVRKGASIRRPEALAAWLYRVAYRIALRLRGEAAERARREQPGVETLPSVETDELAASDLRTVLDEEIDALPERYRQAIVLCCLEGKTHAEAARLLGRPAGTVSCWLKRGRERLRERLTRRGLAPAAAIIALGESEARAVLSAILVKTTCQAANALATGGEVIGSAISARVAALVDAGVKGMAATKLYWTLVLGLTLGMAAAGASMWVYQPPAKQEKETQAPEPSRKQSEQRPRTDRYGDPLPEGAIARLGTVRLRQSGRFWTDPIISPDGKLLTARGGPGLRLWSMSNGKLLWSKQEMTRSLIFSPDSKLLAARDERSICLLDSTTGRLVRRIQSKEDVLAFSPDGKLAVTGSKDNTVDLWEIESGRRIFQLKGHKAPVCDAAFAADSRKLITIDLSKKIGHWDFVEGKLRKYLDTAAPNHRTFRLSPDGRTLAVVPSRREAVRLYDTETGKLRCTLQGAPAAARYGLAFNPDSRILATDWAEDWAEQVTISLWDADTGKPLRRFIVPEGSANSLCLAADGRTLATRASNNSTSHLWDSITGKPVLTWPAHDGRINALQFTPDGRQLVSSDHKTLRTWDIASSRQLRELSRETWGIRDLAVTPDGRSVFSGGHIVARLRDLTTGEEQHRFALDEHPEKVPKPDSVLYGHRVQHIALSADGRTAACVSAGLRDRHSRSGEEVHIWDLASGRLLVHRELGSQVVLLGITPGAAATIEYRGRNQGESNQIVLSDLRTGRRLVTLNLPDLFSGYGYAVSPDGRTMVTATMKAARNERKIPRETSTLRFWELASGKERQAITPDQTAGAYYFEEFAFAPDGRTLATARSDRTLQLWDSVSGIALLSRGSFDSEATVLAFAPDGQRLATGHADSTILIWDTSAPKKKTEQPSPQPSAAEVERWWSALAGDDAHAAWTAIWKMAAAPRQVLPLLRQRLKPAEAIPAGDAGRLIDDLDSSDFAKREAASKRLAEWGDRVVPALEKALKSAPSLEKRRRIEELLPTSEVVHSRDILQAVRAIEVLEHIGTAEAQQILKTLAQDIPEARVTREAKESLKRLNARHSAEKR
ncbi:MAG: sigma-70 family RNA polymerase sigma factor [Gemmataceae bacterium]